MIRDDVQLDLTFALGEIQNIQSELETYFDPDKGILLQRLEGIEARLKELRETFENFVSDGFVDVEQAASAALGRLKGAYVFTED